MGRRLRFLVVTFLVALVPMRAWAAMPCCEAGEAGFAKALKTIEQSAPCHQPELQAESEPSCAFCVVHCVSVAQAVQSCVSGAFGQADLDQIEFASRFSAGVILGQPDRPPLAS